MAYIGNTPAENYASFLTETFTVSATANYTLSHAVTNENDIRLVINGVVQQPGSGKAYTASGTTLTLTSATVSGDVMYAVYLGRALQTVNPPNASVGTAQLADGSVTSAKVDSNAFNTPAFAVRNDGDQSVSSATWTQLTFDTELNDTDSAFASNTFTVPSGKGGLYTFFWGIHGVQGLDAGELVQLGIYINGSRSDYSDNRLTSAATDTEFKFSANFQTNLSPGDTVKAYVYQNEGASQNVTDATFAGYRVIPT